MLTRYLVTLFSLGLLDSIWILGIARGFYARHMNFLFSQKINLLPVFLFYPIYAFGVLFLAVLPAVSSGSWFEAIWRGALLGLVSYGAYDLTNHATIAGWPTIMTVVDMVWGMLVTALTSVTAYYFIMSLNK